MYIKPMAKMSDGTELPIATTNGREGDAREGHDDVQDTHDDFGDGLARNGGKGADDGAADQREGSGAKADDQRVAPP